MEFEAQVPAGMQPGETFMAQTAAGLVALKVPPGSVPGQRMRFSVPAPGASGTAQPVLLGAVVGQPAQAIMGDVEAGQRHSPGRPYRSDPKTAGLAEIPLLQGIPVARAERKLGEIRKGAELADRWPAFPEARRCRDAFWIFPFAALCVAVFGAAAHFAPSIGVEISKDMSDSGGKLPSLPEVLSAGGAGAAAALLASLFFAALANCAPACVVWTSLLLGPSLVIAAGMVVVLAGGGLVGLLLIAMGAMSLCCVFCCYRRYIPFTIRIVEAVAGIMKKNPMTVVVSLAGSIAGIAWSIACGIVFVGLKQKFVSHLEHEQQGARLIAVRLIAVLIFVWGTQVAFNFCHVTYCGIFGRWYHQPQASGALRKSLAVAMTTSFGSICLGSFVVSVVRAIEASVRSARRGSQEDGNVACCILLLVVECIVACIGDFLEYFSAWAYVQCAVRGVSFVEAARITYSMMTCANMQYVLSDLLIDSVVNMGALFSGVVGGAVGAAVGWSTASGPAAASGAIVGAFAGLVTGSSAVGVLSSGTKTLLVLWAENPEPLRLQHPDLHAELEHRISDKLCD